MFLQGDKPTLTRDRAARTLFDNDDAADKSAADTFVNFDYNHNVAEFKNLVQSKYTQSFEPAVQSETSADGVFNKYHHVENQRLDQGGNFQGYYNDSNPIPQQYKTFKPKVLTDFTDLEIPASRGELDDALLQKIDEVHIYEPGEATEKVAFDTITDTDTATESYLKLNTKGLIACITFIAVTLLIIFLVILNGIQIGNSGNQIRRMRDENTQLQEQYEQANTLRSEAWTRGTEKANKFAADQGVEITVTELPSVSSYPLTASNPDSSTNLFDQISKFFSSLFN